jgi:endoglucanase
MRIALLLIFIITISFTNRNNNDNVIRINQLGYTPNGIKVAVWCSKDAENISTFELIDSATGKRVFKMLAGKAFGAYGPFAQTFRLNFSAYKKPGKYYLKAGSATSPVFKIDADVYKGAADFCLRYMRQQRCGYNPFLKDSCHMYDGYTLYGPMKDSTHIDARGGWHDASDYLQYSTTSANATYHLLMAYRDFKNVFGDAYNANGDEGKNGAADVLDEAKWGLDWLLRMHPSKDVMFNQIADDRDHISMRIPKLDSQYGKGFERPVYFVSGEPQQRGKFMNNTTGTSSTAAKFSSAFALGAELFAADKTYSSQLFEKAFTAYLFANKKLGVTQTASVRSPYIYAEDNWVDDMELAGAVFYQTVTRQNKLYFDSIKKATGEELLVTDYSWFLQSAFAYAQKEKLTPWLGADTAKHYQWYPFINVGHYELAKQLKGAQKDSIISYYQKGIEKVWNKAKQNAFYRGVPFIWCSNNLTTSFATQCYWYKQLTGKRDFEMLEQANIDWLFGCNPWGTSMIYGLPSWGDTPVDPHSAFTHLKNYPIDGGLVDGPVYGNIYKSLIGIQLNAPDEYADYQSDLVVYHDDYGDYSTNEPTMDGTASLIYLMAAKEAEAKPVLKKVVTKNFTFSHGAIVRGDTTQKKIAIVFTGDEFADGGNFIAQTLKKENIKASFFFTGRFYRNPSFKSMIKMLQKDGHYLGAHSNDHLLYADWTKRDSTLISQHVFAHDLLENYGAMKSFGISKKDAPYFLPPYEWYNDTVAAWTKNLNLQLINYTPGTLSHADYTTPDAKNYRSTKDIIASIKGFENVAPNGLNGFILLMHVGTDAKRTDKLYLRLPQLIQWLKQKGYQPVRITDLLMK